VDTTTNGRAPKNTLLTIRNGDLIHFGIARCNSELDRFRKDIGKLIASNRANLAVNEANVTTENFVLHNSGLRGTVKVDSIRALLQYFKNIDTSMLPEYLRTEVVNAEAV
jgi:hypothetical protein